MELVEDEYDSAQYQKRKSIRMEYNLIGNPAPFHATVL